MFGCDDGLVGRDKPAVLMAGVEDLRGLVVVCEDECVADRGGVGVEESRERVRS